MWKGPGLPSRPPPKDRCPVCAAANYPQTVLSSHLYVMHGDRRRLIDTIVELNRRLNRSLAHDHQSCALCKKEKQTRAEVVV